MIFELNRVAISDIIIVGDNMKKAFYIIIIVFLLNGCLPINKNNEMIDLSNMNIEEIKEYATLNNLKLEIETTYHDSILKDKVINQSIESGTVIKENDSLKVVISLGKTPITLYKEYKVNELGNVPIMMYHGIIDKKNVDTSYTGGNVDRDGYNRTSEAFRNDLEMYYQKGYRMIRLIDYMNGNIDTELGKSPIVLTFDDGNVNNFKVNGLDDEGNLIIDPNCAVGILEEYKKKYKDFNVTATFFLNSGLFGQSKYNNQILKWLVENGYDIGNHTKNHVDFSNVDEVRTQAEIAYMYKTLDEIIPDKYIKVIALPFGSPYKSDHPNFSYILKGSSEGYNYETEGTLRVGWTYDYSPFHKSFNKTFVKRIRAYDNDGVEHDIQMTFDNLEKSRYISDGDKNTIVVLDEANINVNIKDKKIIKY